LFAQKAKSREGILRVSIVRKLQEDLQATPEEMILAAASAEIDELSAYDRPMYVSVINEA
jgi:hypothetical protein